MKWTKFLLPLVVLFQGGCETTSHTFKVNAMKNPEVAEANSYRIISSQNNSVDKEDSQFQEVSAYVKTALSGKGYYEAIDPGDADLVINIAYGTAPPNVEFKSVQNPHAEGTIHNPIGGRTSPGYPGKPTVPYGTRSKDVVRPQNEIVPITTYEKYLQITAIDNREDKDLEDAPHAWQVTVKNRDESNDLDKYLPLMAAASIPYVGTKTESQEVITLKEDDQEVTFVKTGGAPIDRENVSKFQ